MNSVTASFFKLYTDYRYEGIAHIAAINYMEMEDYGKELIGEYFLILRDSDCDKVVSFVLTGHTGEHSIFTCIYTDYD